MNQNFALISIEQLQSMMDLSISKIIPFITLQTKESPPVIQPVYLSRKETCKFLQITYPTLHKYTKKKILKPYYFGRSVKYLQHEIIAALNSQNNFIVPKKKAA